MDKENSKLVWKVIQERGDYLKGKLKPHPFHPKGRNPYAHIEGLMRRNGISIESATEFALRCLKYQKHNIENETNVLLLTYEELCDNKYESISKIQSFIPEIGSLVVNREFSAHNFKTKGKMKIHNLNSEKINRLESHQISIINTYFIREKSLLDYFGYSIIKG